MALLLTQNLKSVPILLAVLMGSLCLIRQARAQVTPDLSLGPAEQSVVTPQPTNGIPAVQISGGAIRGTNLFHSLQDFNVNPGQGAYFVSSPGIANIFTRVTGGLPSVIDGTVGVIDGNANLFILNPRGLQFGTTASLDLNGSFLATSASRVVFGNGVEFRADQPEVVPMLAINLPLGLQFGSQPGHVISRANISGLEVPDGQTLGLVGGEVSIVGTDLLTLDFLVASLRASMGRIEVGGVDAASNVGIRFLGEGEAPAPFRLDYGLVQNFRDVNLAGALLEAPSGFFTGQSGDIQIQGRQVRLTATSNASSVHLGPGLGGGVTVRASELLALDQNSQLATLAINSAPDSGSGDINIVTQRLLVQGDSRITTLAFGERAGDIFIQAAESVIVRGTGLFNPVLPTTIATNHMGIAGSGGGDLTIETAELRVEEGGLLSTRTFFTQGGDIIIRGQPVVVLRNNGRISTTAGLEVPLGPGLEQSGNGGNIEIDASLVVALPGENSDITATAVQGNGGRIEITTQGLFGFELGAAEPEENEANDISASSGEGLDGLVLVNTPDVDPSDGLVDLPVIVVRPQLVSRCSAGDTVASSSFFHSGRGGVPPSPAESSDRTSIWEDLRDVGPPQAITQRPVSVSEPLAMVEAQGWQRDPSGRLFLMAQALSPVVSSGLGTITACLPSVQP